MRHDVELVITHDGEQWLAGNDDFSASGRSLPELDAKVADALRARGGFAHSPVTVFMGFDFNTIPTWIRQYASHYFNRVVRIDIRGDQGDGRPTINDREQSPAGLTGCDRGKE